MSMVSSKRWVTPSFDSVANTDVPPQKKKATKKALFRSSEASAPIVSINEHRSKTWLDKYQPRSVDDLVIHPKKLAEIEQWFRNHLANQHEKYVALLGPCGCGKTTSLRVLAKKFNFDVVEWITPLDRNFNPDLHGDDQIYQSAAEVFEQFLSRATRYPSLLNVSKSKIVLVKDFPNIFMQQPEILHNILRKYLLLNIYPVAFVCNDDSQARSLLPEAVKKECHMRTISFNPVHSKAVVKALERVLDLERKFNPNVILPKNVDLEAVHQSSAGDLRCAILKLYFNVMAVDDGGGGEVGSKEVSEKRRTAVATKRAACTSRRAAESIGKKDSVQEAVDKDVNTDLFHLLGRVIYSSRQYPDSNKRQDYRFVHNPNELVDTCSCQPYSFVSFLQENYVSRFSSVKSVSKAADSLRRADVLLANGNKEANTTALSVAIRGLMVANDCPVKSFRPFVKSRSSEDMLRTHFADEIRLAFPHFRHSARDIVLYTVPMLNESSFSFDDAQRKIVSKLSAPFLK